MARPNKMERVQELAKVLEGARSVVLNDFTGLNVAKLSELRRLCRASGVEFRVVKNTLAKRSIRDTQAAELEPFFDGPTAVAVSRESENVPAKILAQFAEENEAPKFKVALVDGKVIEAKAVLTLAKLPPREELLSQLLAGIKSPANGLVNVLQGTIRNLVCVLDAIKTKKSSQAGGEPQKS